MNEGHVTVGETFILCFVLRENVSVTLSVVHLLPVWSENRNVRRSVGSQRPLTPTEPLLPERARFVSQQQRRRQSGKKS